LAKHKKGHESHEEHADESWLLPYSDMMTLLLALFVVMFAMSNVDKAKFNAVMEAMYTAFGGTVEEGSPVAVPYPEDAFTLNGNEVVMPPAPTDGKGLSSLYLSLNEYVKDNGLSDSMSVMREGDKVLITLKNDVFFEPGSAELSQDMQNSAKQLATLLLENQDPVKPFDVIVAGHTDNVPINTPQYPSNWYLSVQRAVNFLVAIVTDTGLNPGQFSSRGYGEYMPVATNDTEEGRQQNRRVELLVSENVEDAQSGTDSSS
jgi:chemotaxis protein MotB